MTDRPLDLELVRAFVRVAELSSFTRAAELLGTTQAAVSLKLRKLEQRLGCTLLERSPRLVRLTGEGALFLDRARRLLAVEREAREWRAAPPARLRLGISEHAVGDTLPLLLRRVAAASPEVVFDVRMGFSRPLREAYAAGDLDALVVRREADRRDGEEVRRDAYGWFAARGAACADADAGPLPLALLVAPCGVRATALRALDAAGIAWREAFTGGGVPSVAAAVAAGLAVAPLAARLAPPDSLDIGPRRGLPELPSARIVLTARTAEPRFASALRALAAHLRSPSA